MAHRFSAPSCSQWLWGKVRKRLRRSESRCSIQFGRSEAQHDLSNARTCKNQGTVLWHSNVSAPSARKLFFEFQFFSVGQMSACGAHLWFPKPVFVAAVDWVEWSQSSWHIDFQHRVALSGCGARSGSDCGGPRVGAPSNSVALKLSTICRTRGHLKTKVPYFWHSNVSAPSARKLFFEFKFFLLEKCAPAAHICDFQNPCPSPQLSQ